MMISIVVAVTSLLVAFVITALEPRLAARAAPLRVAPLPAPRASGDVGVREGSGAAKS
jgi:hypothetical protein